MNKYEAISAFMDGEYGQSPEAILASFQSDPELLASWRRYHLIGDALRGQLESGMPVTDLTRRVAMALAAEPTVLSPRPHQMRWKKALKPVAGMAIAASVALVAIVGLRGLDQATSVSAPASVPAVADMTINTAPATINSFASEPLDLPLQSLQPASPAPLAHMVSADATLNSHAEPVQPNYGFKSYLINHNEYRASSGVRGSMPYARIVAPNSSAR